MKKSLSANTHAIIIGTIGSIVGEILMGTAQFLYHGKDISSVTLGTVGKYFVLNAVPMAFMFIAILAYLKSRQSSSKEVLDNHFNEYSAKISQTVVDHKKEIQDFLSKHSIHVNEMLFDKAEKSKTQSLSEQIEYLKLQILIHKFLLLIQSRVTYKSDSTNTITPYYDTTPYHAHITPKERLTDLLTGYLRSKDKAEQVATDYFGH
jgi:hypothetical protein